MVFSEARAEGSSGSYSEDGCFCYSSYWVRKEYLLPGVCLSSIKAIIVVVSPLKALIKDQASCIVVFIT